MRFRSRQLEDETREGGESLNSPGFAVVFELKKHGGSAQALNKSYRSLPDLVNLTNSIFKGPFLQSLQLPAAEVALSPIRSPFERAQPVVEFFEVSSGKMNKGGGAKRIENVP